MYNWKTIARFLRREAFEERSLIILATRHVRSVFFSFSFFFFSLHRTILSISFFEAAATRNAQMAVRG